MSGSKNGSVTRKRFGYGYILGRYLKCLDQSYCEILLLLPNHQSSCHLLLREGDVTGTQPAANRQAEISTPYGWLSSLTEPEHFLIPSANSADLYREAHVQSDNKVARVLKRTGTLRRIAGSAKERLAFRSTTQWNSLGPQLAGALHNVNRNSFALIGAGHLGNLAAW